MYYKSPEPHIILSSLRPAGRRAFTCAHELAHHFRGDSVHVDELVEQWKRPRRFDPKEFAADCFAGALLMPKMAVERAFALHEWLNKRVYAGSGLCDIQLLRGWLRNIDSSFKEHFAAPR